MTENWSNFLLGLALLLIGGTGGGFIIAWKKDNRIADKDEIAITDLIRTVASKTVEDLRQELHTRQKEWDKERKELRDRLEDETAARIKLEKDLQEQLSLGQSTIRTQQKIANEAIQWALAHKVWMAQNIREPVIIPPSEYLKQYMESLSTNLT